jgi:hypothetical protein
MKETHTPVPPIPRVPRVDDRAVERVREIVEQSEQRVRDFFDGLDAPRPLSDNPKGWAKRGTKR